MVDLYRIRAAWSGFPGGPGVSTFYSLGSVSSVPAIRAMFLALAPEIPPVVTIQVEEAGDIVDSVTGTLTGAWSVAPVLGVVGSGVAGYSAPSGFQISWLTSTIVDSHRLKGRTFIVPCGTNVYDLDGTLAPAHRAAIAATAATALAALSGDLVVWHRPRIAAAATAWHPAVTARDGSHGVVTAVSVPDEAVVLRSRRD